MNRWETINDTAARLKVPGGWIYRVFANPYAGSPEMSCVFVPEAAE